MDIFLLRCSLGERFLSRDGRQLVRAIGNKIRLTEQPSFDAVVTSPSATAIQTAELFAERIDHVGVIEVMPSLENDVPPQIAVPDLLAYGSLVVVADEPYLSSLGAFLISRPTFPMHFHAQVSVIKNRAPLWYMRADRLDKQLLIVA